MLIFEMKSVTVPECSPKSKSSYIITFWWTKSNCDLLNVLFPLK